MKLSIIIPIYNSEKYLEQCLESVTNQTYSNLEIILINDGSTDNSEEIIFKYIKKYSKIIKYIKQKNHGQAYARNLGLKTATGELITFVDSDDYIDKNAYKTMINMLERENSDLVICDMYYIKDGKKTIVSGTNFENLYEGTVSVCNKIFKAKFIKNHKFIENIWYEDYNFFIKLCLKNPKYSLCKEPLYGYEIHNNSTMNNNNSKKNLDIITATEDIIINTTNKDLKETIIINHILLDAINRVQNQKNKEKKKIIQELNNYVHKNIKNLFKTKAYKKSSYKKKIILILNFYRLSKIAKIILSIKRRIKE